MRELTIRELQKAVNARLITPGEAERVLERTVSHVTQDSREVRQGSLFVPMKGEKRDGHDFIAQCFAQGAAACLSEKEIIPPENGALLLVENTKKALLDLAEYHRNQLRIPVVGITGSVGKTTTKDMAASVLSQKYQTLWTQGNYNNDIGVPLTLLRLEENHQAAVIEMGMNHFGEIALLSGIVRPDIGVISNVGVAHIENLGSREGILRAKCELFDGMAEDGTAILNADNDMLRTLEGRLTQKIVWFGLENMDGRKPDIYADEICQKGLEQTACVIHTPKGQIAVTVPMPGRHMVLNALSAAAVGLELGLTLEEIREGIECFTPTKNRMNVIYGENGITILNDVYNANPVSMKASLDILSAAKGRKAAVLGFMGELGEFAPAMHREVGEYAAKCGVNLLFCIGRYTDEMAAGAKMSGCEKVFHFAEQAEFLEKGLPLLQKGDTVLVKASRSMELEKTVEKIQGVN